MKSLSNVHYPVLGNTFLHIGTVASAPSYFRHIRYGIYAPPGSETTLVIKKCRFEDLLNSGIYQASGSLDISQSHFTNCYANGIYQDFTRNLTVKTCWFIYNSNLVGIPLEFHNGIHARRFGLGSQVSITYSHFEITNTPESGRCRGIYLKPGQDGVSDGTQINIDFNEINVQTDLSIGINLEDNFLNLTQESTIFHNKFTLFNAFDGAHVFGIFLTGDFQQFSISSNDFFGLQGPDLGLGKRHTSIYFYGQGNSTGNIIASNTWHLPENQTTEAEILDLDFDRAMVINTQEFASICYNHVQNVINVGTFGNLGLHTVFSNNTFAWMAAGPHIDGGEIGLQEHEGNQWIFPAVELNGEFYLVDVDPDFGFHIRCAPDPINSRFFVHTPQATVAFDVWHPFYPLDVEPEMNFFFEDNGTPQECDLPGFGSNVPDLDKGLADGDLGVSQYMSDAELWRQQRRLYRLLQTNAAYYASYCSFPGFVAQHQNGSVGKFYQIHSLLSQSSAASATLSSEAMSQQQILRASLAEIAYLDSLLEIETSPGTILSLKAAQAAAAEDIGSAQNELKDLQEEYETPRASYYQQALMVNSTVNAVAIYEVNEKAFNQVLLNALLNQSGHLTEQDAQTLKSIAAQCPETGGIAVVKSRSLLEDCYEDPTNDYTAECMGEFLTESQVNFRVVSSERNQPMTQTSVVVGEDIFLDVLFVEGSRYSLYDLNGRELRSGKLDPSLRIQIPSGLANGVYVCKVAYPSGKAIVQKVVIAR